MTLTINSNIFALRTERSLADNGNELNRVFNQLSSGQRITKASDDAAGLAIADSLNAKSRVFTQGVRNLNDGISLISIADSALSSLTDITIRLKELAEQSANGVYSDKQRKALDAEAQALSKEFTRVTKSTSFNGLNLFDGSVQGLRLQAGSGVEGSIFSSLGGSKGTGNFVLASALNTGSHPTSVVTGDLDGDGIADLVSADTGTNTATIFFGKGDGTFSRIVSVQTGTHPKSITLGDLNGDGVLDLIAADEGGTDVSILLGVGDGTFKVKSLVQVGNAPDSVAIADFNGDGIMDIASTSETDLALSILLGKGDGTFQNRSTVTAGSGTTSVITADFNGDGIADLATADTGSNTASIFIGKGDGTFQSRSVISTGTYPTAVTAGDLNGDGITDLVSTDYLSNAISIFIGRGDGTFQTRKTVATGFTPQTTKIGDINGDGILDLIGADYGDSTISFYIGKGDGTFQNRTTTSVGYRPTSIATADFNGDGVLDFVTADDIDWTADVFMGKSEDGVSAILAFSLLTKSDSRQSMALFDNKLKLLSTQRGTLGAFQSRIETATNLLQSETENFKAAESRIRDVDVASASAELTRRNILQQAAVSVLAQANQQPAIALTLLRS